MSAQPAASFEFIGLPSHTLPSVASGVPGLRVWMMTASLRRVIDKKNRFVPTTGSSATGWGYDNKSRHGMYPEDELVFRKILITRSIPNTIFYRFVLEYTGHKILQIEDGFYF